MNLNETSRPLIMGILNVTEDSFSDGGRYNNTGSAVDHALVMVYEGADIIDVGGESTRPGAASIAPDLQIDKVVPVITRIKSRSDDITISIDTTSAKVAAAALDAGAAIINDVSAGRDDDDMLQLAADRQVPIILMHMQGTPATMQDDPRYEDVVEEVRSFLLQRANQARAAGIDKGNIIIDPGIGFGKTKKHNLELLARLDRFTDTGYLVMLGASRKRFMGSICTIESYSELVGATCTTTTLGILAGVRLFRVHDVKENRQAADVAYAVINAGTG